VLERYFTDGPYRLQMQFGKSSLAEFYGASAERRNVLQERHHWLSLADENYLAVLPEAGPLIEETNELAVQSQTVPAPQIASTDPRTLLRYLGEQWEPDFLLLSRDQSMPRLVAGCVCFPSSWSLQEKIGRPMDEIHDVVPSLNRTIGRQIEIFLQKLRPDVLWTRTNWGLSRSPERNQHPSRSLPKLHADVGLDDVFFRVEEQSLAALPKTGGILFGIRIKVFPLRDFIGSPAAPKLQFALETMPREVAEYKGLASARSRIIQLLTAS
jgi:hypothetical protein